MKLAGKGVFTLSMIMLCAGLLGGCGAKKSADVKSEVQQETGEVPKDNPAEAPADNTETEETGYVFVYNDVEIVVDTDMSTIAEQLGEPNSYFEEPSCAAQGIAKIYTYSSFQIETYPDGDKDLIACVILKDDNVSTPEGIDLSMTKDDIIAVYGSDCETTERSMVYEKNGTKLCFILDGDSIASIEYDSPVLN